MAGIFDTGIFDTGIFDHAAIAPVQPDERITGGGYWREHKPNYRIHDEYADPPAKKKTKKVKKEGQQIILEGDPVIETGIIEVTPARNALAELDRIAKEAAAARKKRLRALALADDDWLMSL